VSLQWIAIFKMPYRLFQDLWPSPISMWFGRRGERKWDWRSSWPFLFFFIDLVRCVWVIVLFKNKVEKYRKKKKKKKKTLKKINKQLEHHFPIKEFREEWWWSSKSPNDRILSVIFRSQNSTRKRVRISLAIHGEFYLWTDHLPTLEGVQWGNKSFLHNPFYTTCNRCFFINSPNFHIWWWLFVRVCILQFRSLADHFIE
jgi:hypothetical protein